MTWELTPLPYSNDALEPWISEDTLKYHHGEHQWDLVNKLNELTVGTEFEHLELDEIIGQAGTGPVFEYASEVWNHELYWQCLSPKGGGEPFGALANAIQLSYGSFGHFREEFTRMAVEMPVPGWVWLIYVGGEGVTIATTRDTDNPMARGRVVLLAVDLWEHAYYIDYHDDKAAYLEAFWKLVNWDYVEQRLNSVAE